jgi:hypothetical protein
LLDMLMPAALNYSANLKSFFVSAFSA